MEVVNSILNVSKELKEDNAKLEKEISDMEKQNNMKRARITEIEQETKEEIRTLQKITGETQDKKAHEAALASSKPELEEKVKEAEGVLAKTTKLLEEPKMARDECLNEKKKAEALLEAGRRKREAQLSASKAMLKIDNTISEKAQRDVDEVNNDVQELSNLCNETLGAIEAMEKSKPY